MAKEPKTAATVPEVEEVSLVGRADLASWQERLAPYDLEPIERDGAAQVIIVASALRWGFRFRELSVTIAARPTGAAEELEPLSEVDDEGFDAAAEEEAAIGGVFFAEGFQTSRIYTLCERWFFRTPYVHAALDLSLEPASITLRRRGNTLLDIRAGARERVQSSTGTRDWSAPIYLPEVSLLGKRADRSKRYFRGAIAGEAIVMPFRDDLDRFTLGADERHPTFEALMKSEFQPLEWVVRSNAVHVRSKTAMRVTPPAPVPA